MGILGANGTGKSTILKILSNKIQPNFGRPDKPLVPEEIITHYRGNELQNYFQKLYKMNLRISIKPQYVDLLPQFYTGNV